jgi:hypothetical protein
MKEALMKTPLAIVLSVVVAVGVIAANQLGAQPTAPPAASTTTPAGVPVSPGATVQNVVEITRAVPAGTTAVEAFTVPAGVTLVVTDVIVTNTGTAAACGGAVNRAGAAVAATTPATSTTATSTAPTLMTPPLTVTSQAGGTIPTDASAAAAAAAGTTAAMTTTTAGTVTQTDSTVTGPLCVPAQTTTILPLTTGIEFGSGQVVQLLNAPVSAAPTAAGAPGSLAFHLRGLLITLG